MKNNVNITEKIIYAEKTNNVTKAELVWIVEVSFSEKAVIPMQKLF